MRVLIADDHPLILAGIKRALESAEGFEVVAEAHSGSQVLPLISQTDPDLALLDLRMPEMDGLTCLDRIRKQHPKVKVVILSVSTDPEVVQTVLNHGAAAYVALEGTVFSAVGLPEKTAQQDAVKAAGLTERETTILKALARGLSNEAIGKELWVAEQTVKFHLTNIYRKLEVSNRTEAARYAYEHGLIDSPQPEHS
jgi:NarL family two-component system response regulator LiaR